MKLAVIYDSKTGNTKTAAEWIAEGMNSVAGTEAKAFHISDVDADFVREAKGVVMVMIGICMCVGMRINITAFINMCMLMKVFMCVRMIVCVIM